jgi:hypothetical protein
VNRIVETICATDLLCGIFTFGQFEKITIGAKCTSTASSAAAQDFLLLAQDVLSSLLQAAIIHEGLRASGDECAFAALRPGGRAHTAAVAQ